MTKWGKAKILIAVVVAVLIFAVSFDSIDPLYATETTVPAIVKQSVQITPRYSKTYNRIIVETKNGDLYTFEMPLEYSIKSGDTVVLRMYKRKLSGLRTYKIK